MEAKGYPRRSNCRPESPRAVCVSTAIGRGRCPAAELPRSRHGTSQPCLEPAPTEPFVGETPRPLGSCGTCSYTTWYARGSPAAAPDSARLQGKTSTSNHPTSHRGTALALLLHDICFPPCERDHGWRQEEEEARRQPGPRLRDNVDRFQATPRGRRGRRRKASARRHRQTERRCPSSNRRCPAIRRNGRHRCPGAPAAERRRVREAARGVCPAAACREACPKSEARCPAAALAARDGPAPAAQPSRYRQHTQMASPGVDGLHTRHHQGRDSFRLL